MATYICLLSNTDEGAKRMHTFPQRVEAVRKDLEARGMTYRGAYFTIGPYDAVIIVESPTEELLVQALVENAMRGNARTMTMRAFSDHEMEAICKRIPTP
jgi:uncharacterized protein with GYD domain